MEEWREVPGHPNYRVSSEGRVRGPRRILKPKIDAGYRRVRLGRTGGHHLVHLLVLRAFVGPAPEGMEGCHNDGNAQNNCVENLRWDTRQANKADMRTHGTHQQGEMKPSAKLTDVQARAILESSATTKSLAEEYGVHPGTVRKIRARTSWRHL